MEQQSKILIVDDNPLNIDLLEERLEDYQLESASSGEEALEIASEFQPDLILLDIMLPGMNGCEVCRKMRENPGLYRSKIIMVSAKAMLSERLQGYEAGADDYITKPFDGQEILAKVRVYLKLKSAEELQESEERFRSLFDDSPTPLWEEDFSAVKNYLDNLEKNGVVDFESYFNDHPEELHKCATLAEVCNVNKAALNMLDVEKKEKFIGPLSDIFKEETYDIFRQQLLALLKGKECFESETINRTFTGREIYVYMKVTVAPHCKDNWMRLFVAITDITEQKQAQEKLHLQATALNSAANGIIITDSRNRIVWCNPAITEITGYGFDELIGKDPNIFNSEKQNKKNYQDYFSTIKTGKVWRGELRNKKKDGSLYYEELTVTPVRNEKGEINFFIGIQQDITERKRIEAELIEINETLEQRVEVRSKELLHAKKQAESASEAKSNFVSNMSHELRTPLHAIVGMIYLLKDTTLSLKQRNFVKKLDIASRSLLDVINNILDFSKIEAKEQNLEITKFNLEDVFANLVEMISVKLQTKSVEFMISKAPEVPSILEGDRLRLGQILLNLTSNAVKFTEFGEILVSAELVKNEKNWTMLKFLVQDSGIGLTEMQISRLFKPFNQADSSHTRKYGGTGLGLAISKSFVELMGGEIGVKSEAGTGSTFFFTMKFHLPPKQENEHSIALGYLKDLRVLVVEDNFTFRGVLKNYMDCFSIETTLVKSGEMAINELRKALAPGNKPYDLVIIDHKLPDINGIETLIQIKQDPEIDSPPFVIFLSDSNSQELLKNAEEAGADVLLEKPISQSLLFDTIIELFKESGPGSRCLMRSGSFTIPERIREARILVVDDNEINRQVAEELLNGKGFRVTTVSNGKKAIELIVKSTLRDAEDEWNDYEKVPFDLILMDLQMPEMDGFAVTRKIRNLKASPTRDDKRKSGFAMPIIAMTADAAVGIREKCLEAGMDDYLTKPIKPRDLFLALGKWIEPGNRKLSASEHFPDEGSENFSEEASFQELIGINTKDGLNRVLGNQKLYRELLGKFRKKNKNFVNAFNEALDSGDTAKAVQMVHTMKGVSGNLGADDLYNIADKLETILKEGKRDEVNRLSVNLSHSLNQVLTSIKELEPVDIARSASTRRDGGGDRAPIEEIIPTLVKLKDQLKEYDSDAIGTLHKVEQGLQLCSHHKEATELFKRIDNFEFDEAVDLVLGVINSLEEQLENTGEDIPA